MKIDKVTDELEKLKSHLKGEMIKATNAKLKIKHKELWAFYMRVDSMILEIKLYDGKREVKS